MTTTPDIAAQLHLLTQALDLPGTDLADTLARLVADVRSAVSSYLGLTIAITGSPPAFHLTVLGEGTVPDQIHTSLLVPLTSAGVAAKASPSTSVVLILYAGTPGAFVDLAADLSWITGRHPSDFRLDEHRALPADYANNTDVRSISTINQAIGVLIGAGSTPEQAERELHARAAAACIELVGAAALVLADLTRLAPRPDDS